VSKTIHELEGQLLLTRLRSEESDENFVGKKRLGELRERKIEGTYEKI
jgi:hypothetical protein